MNRDQRARFVCQRCGQTYSEDAYGFRKCYDPSAPGAGGFACGGALVEVGDSTPPATPVESPDENWFQRQARLAARDVQLLPPWLRSHPPAVSGEGERLKELLADLQTLENTYNTDRVAQVQARQIERIFDRWLHSTPTPGAPR